MLRVIVDSGSSIKKEEKEKYNVDILPLRIIFDDKEYHDTEDIDINTFYDLLFNTKEFPKTSLPNLENAENLVNSYTNNGDDVIIITISSKLSGTYNTLKMLFADKNNVLVYDSLSCVSGIKLLVDEINKDRSLSLNEIKDKLDNLRNKIKIYAIPENLNYLLKGGRLSKKEWLLGSIIHIKPIITMKDGKVEAEAKKRGLLNGKKYIIDNLNIDSNYKVYGAYTYNDSNLIKFLSEANIVVDDFDNLSPSIAAHWGPNAFGVIYIQK